MIAKRINVYGMNCEHCAKSVDRALSSLKGISSVVVSLEGKFADVTYDENFVGIPEIKKAVSDAGYRTD